MSVMEAPAPVSLETGVSSATPRRRTGGAGKWGLLFLLAWCGFVFFAGLDAGDLYRTESLRAILAAECLRGGNWVVPSLYGEPLLTKPPGMYLAIGLASWPVGEVRPWTARLPSALAALGTVLLLYTYFARQLGRPAGLAAAFIVPMSVMWLDKAPAAEIDMLQLAWVAAALVCFLRALEAREARDAGGTVRPVEEWLWWQAALLAVAGGVLTKWTAPAFFYLTVVPLLAWRGRLRLLLGGAHLASLAVAVGLCLAWVAAAVTQVGWDLFRDTVGREALARLSPLHHTRPYPWGEVVTFPLVFLAANLPWSGLALYTLRPGFAALWDERGRRLLQALHCWTCVNLGFWSLVPGHHFRHAMPLQPGLAGLAALVWTAWLTGRLRWTLHRLSARGALVGLLLAWLAIKVAFVTLVIPAREQGREPRAKGERIASLVPPGEPLYLDRLKDEGILFYYGRPARRLPGLTAGPPARPGHYLLVESEWQSWQVAGTGEVLLRLDDEQGSPLVLVRIP